MDSQRKYWFPAKRYGWGWGPLTCWQGWGVFVAYAAAWVLIALFLPPTTNLVMFLVSIALSTAVLLTVCWLKGEPPKWRWGNDDRG